MRKVFCVVSMIFLLCSPVLGYQSEEEIWKSPGGQSLIECEVVKWYVGFISEGLSILNYAEGEDQKRRLTDLFLKHQWRFTPGAMQEAKKIFKLAGEGRGQEALNKLRELTTSWCPSYRWWEC